MYSESERRILGSFDPATIYLDFREHDIPPVPLDEIGEEVDLATLLAYVDSGLIAHELAHWVQSAGTASGLGHFWLGINHVDQLLETVRTAGAANSGRISAPILRNRQEYLHSEDYRAAEARLLITSSRVLNHVGGAAVAVAESLPEGAGSKTNLPQWYFEPGFGTMELAERTVQVRGKSVARISTAPASEGYLSLGYRHLAEGQARAIELLWNYENVNLPLDPVIFENDTLPIAADPYYVAFQLYLDVVGPLDPSTRRLSLEEFAAVVDLAFMLDPQVLRPRQDLPDTLRGYFDRSQAADSFHVFVDLLEALRTAFHEIPGMVPNEATRETLHDFQTALLRHLLRDQLSLLDLTALALASIDDVDAVMGDPRSIYSDSALRLFYFAGARWLLEWRRDECGGAAMFPDLLASESTLYSLVKKTTPGLSIGPYFITDQFRDSVAGAVGSRYTTGELLTRQAVNDVLRSVVYSDSRCPLAKMSPRRCSADPQDLCASLLAHPSHACARADALEILTGLGVSIDRP